MVKNVQWHQNKRRFQIKCFMKSWRLMAQPCSACRAFNASIVLHQLIKNGCIFDASTNFSIMFNHFDSFNVSVLHFPATYPKKESAIPNKSLIFQVSAGWTLGIFLSSTLFKSYNTSFQTQSNMLPYHLFLALDNG